MDAALELEITRLIERLSIRAAGRHEHRLSSAFGRHVRRTREVVQERYDPTAEVRDACECVHFATVIDCDKRVAERRLCLGRCVAPGACGLMCREQSNELGEAHAI